MSIKDNKTVEILLVEDNDQDAELAIRSLMKSNVANDIVRLTNGEEALEFIFGEGKYKYRSTGNQPKVVFLDLKMPKVDGLEVLEAVRAQEETRNLPIVILTSSKEENDVARSYRLGANSYVVKPVEFASFAKTVRKIGRYWVLLNQRPE